MLMAITDADPDRTHICLNLAGVRSANTSETAIVRNRQYHSKAAPGYSPNTTDSWKYLRSIFDTLTYEQWETWYWYREYHNPQNPFTLSSTGRVVDCFIRCNLLRLNNRLPPCLLADYTTHVPALTDFTASVVSSRLVFSWEPISSVACYIDLRLSAAHSPGCIPPPSSVPRIAFWHALLGSYSIPVPLPGVYTAYARPFRIVDGDYHELEYLKIEVT